MLNSNANDVNTPRLKAGGLKGSGWYVDIYGVVQHPRFRREFYP